jgi:DNA-binding Lrp family transcriptional regulator
MRIYIQVPDEKGQELLKKFVELGAKVYFGRPRKDLSEAILRLLKESSPQSYTSIQRRFGRPTGETRAVLNKLVEEGKIIKFEMRVHGRPAEYYGIRDAENLKPLWEIVRKEGEGASDSELYEILSEKATPEESLFILRTLGRDFIPQLFEGGMKYLLGGKW